MRRILLAAVAAVGYLLAGEPALAHTSERGFIMLLPTHLYQIGGTAAVVLSFALLIVLPPHWLKDGGCRVYTCCGVPWLLVNLLSIAAFISMIAIILAGFMGSRDPLANPLPLTLWSLVWVGLTMAHVLVGNLWRYLNPWRGAALLGGQMSARLGHPYRPPLMLPKAVATWPAVALLSAFVWLELVYPAPMDPFTLAVLGLGYAGLTLTGMAVFGAGAWWRAGELFSVFFSIVSRVALFNLAHRHCPQNPRLCLQLGVPGRALVAQPALSASLIAFIIIALASVSFDSFSRTFTWFAWNGNNPLEPPGRSAMIGANSLGLIAAPLALWLAYLSAVVLGSVLSGQRLYATRRRVNLFVVSIIPIAVGYHLAHYLPAFSVDAQHALKALSDPFALGWNLLGLSDFHVRASLLSHHHTIELFWYAQVAIIVIAHVVAVVVAHALAARDAYVMGTRLALMLGELPLTVLMAAYTLLGLWLLSTPTAG
ncbi:MAG: hypothetical protein GKR94_34650 [Gammaproteobacteria bacterium]|nr:hypothetical protein [Gammaproteobacteria bacterium]